MKRFLASAPVWAVVVGTALALIAVVVAIVHLAGVDMAGLH